MPEGQKPVRVGHPIQAMCVEFPPRPPPRFAPIAWDDVRRLSRCGVTFGPHTVTHPVLSRTGDEQSRFEIVESWRRVRDEAGDGAVPVFCYPNGERGDFTAREESTVALNGMRAALSTSIGYASHRHFSVSRPMERFRLPRFSYSEASLAFIQVASGVERAKMALRAAIGGDRS
jgi:hypothetical protein